jgi:inorganic pyrophosphatase
MNGTPTSLLALPSFDPDTKLLNAIIETPKGARNKFSYDEKLCLFRLKKVLPAGAIFPYHFGFIPGTWAEDDGPLDVLVLMEEPAFPGCLVASRLLGVIEASQTKKGRTLRNDRFIAVADSMPSLEHYQTIKDLEPNLIEQIEHFFVSYNHAEGKMFKPLRRSGPSAARNLIAEGVEFYRRESNAR